MYRMIEIPEEINRRVSVYWFTIPLVDTGMCVNMPVLKLFLQSLDDVTAVTWTITW